MTEVQRHGANVIIHTGTRVRIVQHTYGSKMYALPGGGIEFEETAEEAARRETLQETGVTLPNRTLTLVGKFIQRLPEISGGGEGDLWLFEVEESECLGEIVVTDPEIQSLRTESAEELVANLNPAIMGLGYRKLLAHWLNWKSTESALPIEGEIRLSAPVAIHIDHIRGQVLSI